MPKLKREQLELLFDKLNVKAAALICDGPPFTRVLNKLKQEILDEEAPKTIAARDFDIEMAVMTFGLQFVDYGAEYLWKIEDIPVIQDSPTSFLGPNLAKYAQTVDRSSEAACRTPVDLILIECVAELQGKTKTLVPHRNVKICFDVPFSHRLSPKPTAHAATAISHAGTVNGRVDYGVGIITPRRKFPTRRFRSLLIAVEAKAKNNLDSAFSQLIVYLACLRQARKARGRTDWSVYGITSDGYEFCFVTITHEGLVKVSRQFSISRGEMKTVMGCIMYILRRSLAVDESNETDDQDEAMKLDDNGFLHPTANEEAE